MSRAQGVVTNLLAFADVRIDGDRPWDIQVHDQRFFSRVLASGTLGFGESYMEGWWDCDELDEMCCRAIRAGLEKRKPWPLEGRARLQIRRHCQPRLPSLRPTARPRRRRCVSAPE